MESVQKVVIALGGNALQSSKGPFTADAQLKVVNDTSDYIAEIVLQGYEIALVHGNGPQVGRILLASETAKDVTPSMPFDVCGAMSQGYIGYHIQQGVKKALKRRNKEIPIVTLITQVVVDKDDRGFTNPTKPIGPFYTEEEAKLLERERGYVVREDSGRGYRRVVASPKPVRICEIDSVNRLWKSTIVVACGGGGIPVIETEKGIQGVAAVIDKDFAASLLADETDANILMILTEVEKVAIRYNKPDQQDLSVITVDEAEKYAAEGHFAPGSMLPKVQAAVEFVKKDSRRKAIITSLNMAVQALEGKTGTTIIYK
ncbi:MAG: carbamate kinase [Lachnospiraceae bacterium]